MNDFMKLHIKNYLSYLAILIVLVTVIYTNYNIKIWQKDNRVLIWDIKEYYVYLPAAFIYHDITLKFKDENPNFFKYRVYGKPLENGNRVTKMTMGLSYLYAPFFFMAHAFSIITAEPANGYTWIYKFALQFSSLFYLIMGLIVLRKLLKSYFNDIVVGLTLLAIFFGTNLLYYSTIEATMSHAYSFFLFSVFLWLIKIWHKKQKAVHAILLGLVFGLISLIRPTNGIIAFLFLFWNVQTMSDFFLKFKLFFKNYQQILLIMLFAFIIWCPQLLYWKKVTGSWFYYSYSDEGFFFEDPAIIKGLFSFRKGWLIYSPIVIFALAGIPLLYRKIKGLFLPVLIFVALNLYIVFSWWTWWYGGSFGQRALIESYSILSIPFAVILEKILRSRAIPRFASLAVITIFFTLGLWNNIKYYYGSIHWDSMTREAYFDSFWKAKPAGSFHQKLEKPDYTAAKKGVR
jgi:hypothetical protein